jgi:hypothetical protein
VGAYNIGVLKFNSHCDHTREVALDRLGLSED